SIRGPPRDPCTAGPTARAGAGFRGCACGRSLFLLELPRSARKGRRLLVGDAALVVAPPDARNRVISSSRTLAASLASSRVDPVGCSGPVPAKPAPRCGGRWVFRRQGVVSCHTGRVIGRTVTNPAGREEREMMKNGLMALVLAAGSGVAMAGS